MHVGDRLMCAADRCGRSWPTWGLASKLRRGSERKILVLAAVLGVLAALCAPAILLPSAARADALPPNLITNPGTQISACDSTAGWTLVSGTNGTLAPDTKHREGSASLKLTPATAGGAVTYQASISADMSGPGVVRFWVYLSDDLSSYSGIFVRLSATTNFSSYFYYYPANLHKYWNLVSVAKGDFLTYGTPSWSAPMVRLRIGMTAKAGYQPSVNFDDIRYGVQALPAVVMSFKNGTASQFTDAFPIMAQHGLVGNAFIDSGTIGKSGSMTVNQLQQLYAAGWDIGNHSSTSDQLTSFTLAGAEQHLLDCTNFIIANGMPRAAHDVAYVDGQYNDTVLQAMAETGMTSGTMVDYRPLALPLDEPYLIPSTDAGYYGVTKTEQRIDQAIRDNAVIQLVFHDVTGTTSSGYTLSDADFTQLCDYIVQHNLPVLTITQLKALNDDPLGVVQTDRWAPQTTASTVPADGGLVRVSLTAVDHNSGVAATYYKLDDATDFSLYSGAFTLDPSQPHTLTYYSVDNAGNSEAPHTMTDFQAPTTLATPSSGWSSGTIVLSATDILSGNSGIKEIDYSLDGGTTWISVASDTAFVTAFTNEGAATLTFHAVDGVGNIEADQTISLLIDKTPPVSTLSGADDSWHSGPVTLSLSAVDSAIGTDYPDGSGVHSVWYRIDGNPAVETLGAGPVSITVDSDGAHYVTYWATDNAGNSEAPRMVSVRIAGLPVPPNLVSYTGTQISSFDSATEWTVSLANGASGTESEDTVHFREGTGSLQLTTGIAGGEVVVQKTINQDMSSMLYGGRVRLWVYLPRDWHDTVGTFRVRFSPDPLFSRSFYYTNSDMTGMHEGWNLISVGASSFLSSTVAPSWTDTMVAVRMEVRAKTGQMTTVGFDDLRVGVVTTPAVLFSFDDDDVSVYNSAYPILQSYGIEGTAYVPSADVQSGSSGKMNLTQLQDLYAHGWDIGNHTVNHTNLTTVDLATAESELRGCADFLIQNGMPRAARDVAYPNGAYNPTVLQAMSETGMLTGRLVDYRPMALPIAEPYMIPASSTDATKLSVGDIEARIDRAVNNGGVIELYFHAIGETTDSYTQSIDNLTQICQYVRDMGIPTMTISQLREDSFGSPESIPPVTTTDYDGLWHNGPVTLHFTATDVGSGVYYTEYSLDGGNTWTAGTSTTVSNPGQTTVLYRSLDKAGNLEWPESVTVNIDTTPPTVSSDADSDTSWHNSDVTVTLTAADEGGSGLAQTQYRLQGARIRPITSSSCRPLTTTASTSMSTVPSIAPATSRRAAAPSRSTPPRR